MIPIIPFVIGGAVGAVGALLLSPRSGEENRELVAEKVDYYAGHGEQIFHRAADTVRDTADNVVDNAQPAADDIREKINEARDRIAEQVMRSREAEGAVDVEAEVEAVEEEAVQAEEAFASEDAAE